MIHPTGCLLNVYQELGFPSGAYGEYSKLGASYLATCLAKAFEQTVSEDQNHLVSLGWKLSAETNSKLSTDKRSGEAFSFWC